MSRSDASQFPGPAIPLLAVFGGTFDPVHCGHIETVAAVRNVLNGVPVLFVPAGQPPHRAAPIVDVEHRLAMLRLALAGQDGLSLDERELCRQGPSYTILTLEELKAERQGVNLCLVLGLDAALDLPHWHRWRGILALAHVIVMCRPGWEVPDPPPSWWSPGTSGNLGALTKQGAGRVAVVTVPALEVSSSGIRADLTAGRDVAGKLSPEVLEYIGKHGLYNSHD